MGSKGCASAWNSAGTWEEKSLEVGDFCLYLNHHPKDFCPTLLEVEGLSGKASVIFVSGKRKLGFKVKGKFRFEEGDLEVEKASDTGKLRSNWTPKGEKACPLSKEEFLENLKAALLRFIG